MNSKRSYLDTLNAGRERKPSTTLEQITQSLQNLESRLDRSRDALDEFGRDREPPTAHGRQPPYEPHPATASAKCPRARTAAASRTPRPETLLSIAGARL